MYDFHKKPSSSSGPNVLEFLHPLFRRGEKHVLPSIKRKSVLSADRTRRIPGDFLDKKDLSEVTIS